MAHPRRGEERRHCPAKVWIPESRRGRAMDKGPDRTGPTRLLTTGADPFPPARSPQSMSGAPAAPSGDRGGFGRGRGDRRGPRRGPRRGARKDEEQEWMPVTKLGRLVKDGKIKSIEEVCQSSCVFSSESVGMGELTTLARTRPLLTPRQGVPDHRHPPPRPQGFVLCSIWKCQGPGRLTGRVTLRQTR